MFAFAIKTSKNHLITAVAFSSSSSSSFAIQTSKNNLIMAAAFSSSSSSSSTVTPPSNYDVFLSFRGEDTREKFTSHLFAALLRKQIKTFMDEDINKGARISPEFLNGKIEGSRISVIIFSENYASSKWCLDELVRILECKEKIEQIVIPVFYHVHPSDVRKKTGKFGKAFGENKKTFKKMADKVQKRRDALTEASYLAGHESRKFRNEAELVEVIVRDVLKKLKDTTVSVDSNGLVGINYRIEEVKSLLCIGLQDFRIVGIWGMGGIGKTTLADAIFHQISNQFEGKCFMASIREKSKWPELQNLRDRFLSEILEDDIKIQTPSLPENIKRRLQGKKVFIVLDDVNEQQQFENLRGGLDQLGAGSKIIVTTRNKQVLDRCGIRYTYNVEPLNYHEAQQLFRTHAFRENPCPADLMAVPESLLGYADGNPLALKVLGSFFRGKSRQDCENIMQNIKWMSSPDIDRVLKISYDDMEWELQQIFLDVACFFKGYEKDHMTVIFNGLYSINCGLDILVDRSLITISNNTLQMHDLLQEMGWKIVREESVEEPRKRSRLWDHKDILRVLHKNKKAPELKYIDLHHSQYVTGLSDLLEAPKLERVNIGNCKTLSCISSSIQKFNNLGHLSLWGCTSLKCFPSNIYFRSPITIDLNFCVNLTTFPEISGNVVRLFLIGTNIQEVPSSIENMTDLQILWLDRCERLEILSTSLCKLKSLRKVLLSDCSKLHSFPKSEKMEHIEHLDFAGTAIKEMPSSIENVVHLCCSGCRGLVLPDSLSTFSSLGSLALADCGLTEIPQDIGCLVSLKSLHLDGNNFKSLPLSIKYLSKLERLNLSNCNMLQSLPELPLALIHIKSRNCQRLQSLPELSSPAQELDASVLELVSKIRIDNLGGKFNFMECVKLNESNILADSQRWIQHLAVVRMRYYSEKVKIRKYLNQSCTVSLCFPGSRIPEWCSHQSLGSSITIPLSPFCCNRNLIGFALCAVIACEQPLKASKFFFCDYYLKTKPFSKTEYAGGILLSDFSYESDHVCLGFVACLTDVGHHITVSIDLSIYEDKDKDKEKLKVKRVGVCPVYAHQSETKPNTFIVNMVPPTEEEYKKLHNEFYNEACTSGSAIPIDTGRFDEEKMSATRRQSSFLSQIFGCWGLDYNCLWRIFQPCFEM